jgi:hypothetical protein
VFAGFNALNAAEENNILIADQAKNLLGCRSNVS